MRKSILAFGALTLLLAGCETFKYAPDDVPLVKLGAKQKSYLLDAEGSSISLDIISNVSFTILGAEENPWLSLSAVSGDGSTEISARAERNTSFKRMAVLAIASDVDERRDTILVKQQGAVEAVLAVGNTAVVSSGAGGDQLYPITTNVPFDDMNVDIAYVSGGENWIRDISIDDAPSADRRLRIVTEANPSEVDLRMASIRLSFVDGWGETREVSLNLIQKNSLEDFGKKLQFETVRNDWSDGEVIGEYVYIEGIVVSDKTGANAAENEQVTATTIDYSGAKKSVFVESLDGRYGFKLLCQTEEDNVFNQWDKVQIMLKGAKVIKVSDPERYHIDGVTRNMVVSQERMTKSQAPVKNMHIRDLSDSDIYTYVTLQDVEFPVRKGPLAPVNEGSSIGTNAHRIDKYPRLIRDINGDVSYVMTNTTCLYRNDGTVLPYGSGSMSGVIVHERFVKYEFKEGAEPQDIENDPTLGFIGKYQLRHQTKDDIWGAMNESVEDSFSALLTEYRFVNPDPDSETTHVALPTYGTNGWLTHTYQEKYTGSETKNAVYQDYMPITFVYNFTYMGPIGNSSTNYFGLHKGNENGIGVILDMEKEHYSSRPAYLACLGTSKDGRPEWCAANAPSEDCRNINLFNGSDQPGKGICPGGTRNTFCQYYWWDLDTGRPYGWLLNFSTKGISTDHISLQFTALNYEFYTPRFWKVEWSEQDSQAPEADALWHYVASYTIPDRTDWSLTTHFSLSAYKQFDIALPLDILGKDNVYLRLVPESDVASTGSSYADTTVGASGKAAHQSAMDYLAIRYNK